MKKKEFMVIGVGDFGEAVIKTLSNVGASLLVVDKNSKSLERITNVVTKTVCADATDQEVLKQLAIKNFDGVIIAFSNNVAATTLIVMQLKEMNIKYIMAKASNELEGRILRKLGADKIVYPEREMGIRIANQLVNDNFNDAIELSEDHSIIDFPCPSSWVGKTLPELSVRSVYNVMVIGIRTKTGLMMNPKVDYQLNETDILIILGENIVIKELLNKEL